MVQLTHNFKRRLHPMGPKIIFSYGMTKCGSTLAFELARTALELSGFPQPIMPREAIGVNKHINFARHLTEKQVTCLEDYAYDLGHPIVIKTHTRPDPPVIDLINRGKAVIHASYRDPREIILSMLDHGRKSRLARHNAFSEIATIDDAIFNLHGQVDSFTQWLYRPNCLPIYYHDLAFRMPLMTKRILENIMIDMPMNKVKNHVLNRRFIQFNKGIKNRYQNEMDPTDQKRIRNEFPNLFRLLIRDRMFLPHDGRPILPEGILLAKTRGDTGGALP